jgi:ketosteroid isomerase-like protein
MGQAANVAHTKMAAFNAQDAERLLALLGSDVEWAVPGGLLRGGDQVIAFCLFYGKHFPTLS